MSEPTTPPERPSPGLSRGAIRSGQVARAAIACIRATRAVLRQAGMLVLALIIIFEEWGWRPLANLLGRLGQLAPFAALERSIQRLPPYAALAVFAVPSAALFPLKLLALYLIAQGHAVAATGLFIAAKLAGTAVVARLFILTETQLMAIPWFKRGYDRLLPWKHALTDWVRASPVWQLGRAVKQRLTAAGTAALARLRAALGR